MPLKPYPLRTEPFFRDYLWGGRKLQTRLGKALPANGVWAESWEVIDHPEHQSVVTNGELAGKTLRQITAEHRAWLLGEDNCADNSLDSLPLLLKYLDCQRVLSVQVHPDDAYGAQMSPPDLGKTEAWYIIDAEPGAKLYAGLRFGVTPQQLRMAIEAGEVDKCLHVIQPRPGDCVFIPAGTVHALGEGLLVAEIQQASNTTFRLFDWNRVDANGQPRALHVDQALEVIDFDSGPRELQKPEATEQHGRERLAECDKFVFDRIRQSGKFEIAEQGFHLLTSPSGGVTLRSPECSDECLDAGESVLVPAAMSGLVAELSQDAVLLDMYLPG